MRTRLSVLISLCLAGLYPIGLLYAIGAAFALEFPWQPYAGTSVAATYALGSIPHLLAVLTISLAIAAVLAPLFATRAYRVAILVALPGTLLLLWDVVRSMLSVPPEPAQAVTFAKDLLVVCLTPAACTYVLAQIISKQRFEPTDPPSA